MRIDLFENHRIFELLEEAGYEKVAYEKAGRPTFELRAQKSKESDGRETVVLKYGKFFEFREDFYLDKAEIFVPAHVFADYFQHHIESPENREDQAVLDKERLEKIRNIWDMSSSR